MKKLLRQSLSIVLTALGSFACVASAAEPLEYRWVYMQQNLQVTENLPTIEQKLAYFGRLLLLYRLVEFC